MREYIKSIKHLPLRENEDYESKYNDLIDSLNDLFKEINANDYIDYIDLDNWLIEKEALGTFNSPDDNKKSPDIIDAIEYAYEIVLRFSNNEIGKFNQKVSEKINYNAYELNSKYSRDTYLDECDFDVIYNNLIDHLNQLMVDSYKLVYGNINPSKNNEKFVIKRENIEGDNIKDFEQCMKKAAETAKGHVKNIKANNPEKLNKEIDALYNKYVTSLEICPHRLQYQIFILKLNELLEKINSNNDNNINPENGEKQEDEKIINPKDNQEKQEDEKIINPKDNLEKQVDAYEVVRNAIANNQKIDEGTCIYINASNYDTISIQLTYKLKQMTSRAEQVEKLRNEIETECTVYYTKSRYLIRAYNLALENIRAWSIEEIDIYYP